MPSILQGLLAARKATRVNSKYKTIKTKDGKLYSGLISEDDNSDETSSPKEIFRSLGEAIAEKGMTIREVFESLDADLDGRINGPELQDGISEILGDNLDSTTVFELLGVLDSDDDGSIDPMELIEAIEGLELEISSDEMSDLIATIDDDEVSNCRHTAKF